MARLVTLLSLRTQAQQRADMVNSTFLTPTEWNTNINNSATDLYDILTRTFEDYNIKQAQLSLSGGQFLFPLPTDFYKLSTVDEVIGGSIITDGTTGVMYVTGQAVSVKPYNVQNRNSYVVPRSSSSVLLGYVPTMTPLVADSDTFDGINGWEEYIIIDSAIKAAIKEEGDISELNSQKSAVLDRIKRSAPNRDVGGPIMMTDVYASEPSMYLVPPTRLRYNVQGNVIRFAESYVLGDVW
jgi:hypothetical protein